MAQQPECARPRPPGAAVRVASLLKLSDGQALTDSEPRRRPGPDGQSLTLTRELQGLPLGVTAGSVRPARAGEPQAASGQAEHEPGPESVTESDSGSARTRFKPIKKTESPGVAVQLRLERPGWGRGAAMVAENSPDLPEKDAPSRCCTNS
eukprot:2402804-Rhodomonas_salina.1